MEQIKYQKSFCKSNSLISVLDEINTRCNEEDHLEHHYFIDEDYHDFSDKPCAYLAKCGEETVGFLCPYEIDRYNIEFCLFVLPEYRRQKIGSQLFFHLVMDYQERSFSTSLLPGNQIGKDFLENIGFTYGCCECSMALLKNSFKPVTPKMELDVHKEEDEIYVTGLIGDIEIGSFAFTVSNTTACIHDVEVKEDLRRKGYGYQMVASALQDIFEKYDTVILHVTKENVPAYHLYKKLNFRVLEELDYYEL
jgi:ribosomal protein S18 acetylase RimI-like enzyme